MPTQQPIVPKHIVAGLGGADRRMLSTCLALFDDSTLKRHLTNVYDASLNKLGALTGAELSRAVDETQSRQAYWFESDLSDGELRLVLWIQLRSSFNLPERLTVSFLGAGQIADDLAAAMINLLDPPPARYEKVKGWIAKKGIWSFSEDKKPQALTLQAVVEPVLSELMQAAVGKSAGEQSSQVEQEVLDGAVRAMSEMSEEDQRALREELGVDELNTAAARKIIATGGGLAAISGSVSMAGFSAYILAAQASAFIPLVSGPGLVSLLSVVSNPITLVVGTAAAAWWFSQSAMSKVRATISTRVISMLAIQGLHSGQEGLRQAILGMQAIEKLGEGHGLRGALVQRYQNEWQRIEPAASKDLVSANFSNWRYTERPLIPEDKTDASEAAKAAALTGMTVGDVLYATASIDPDVIQAADFSYIENIDGPIAFATLAEGFTPGSLSRLKGYVAEQAVATELISRGHAVSLPEASNQAGWDLLVDGQPFQVKFRENIQGIREHFKEYDYPVIANDELMGHIPEELVDQVFFIEGLSNELVTHVTDRAQEMAASVTSPDVPTMALILSAYSSVKGLWSGELTKLQATELVLLDGSVRVGLAFAGQVVGAGAGLLIFGPAGAWVMGAGLPILAQSQTKRTIGALKQYSSLPKYRVWAAEVHSDLDNLHQSLSKAVTKKRNHLKTKYKQTNPGGAGRYIRWRFRDSVRHTRECEQRLNAIANNDVPDPMERLKDTLRWIAASCIHPASYQTELAAVTTVLKQRPGLLVEVDTYWSAEPKPAETAELTTAAGSQPLNTSETETQSKKNNGAPWRRVFSAFNNAMADFNAAAEKDLEVFRMKSAVRRENQEFELIFYSERRAIERAIEMAKMKIKIDNDLSARGESWERFLSIQEDIRKRARELPGGEEFDETEESVVDMTIPPIPAMNPHSDPATNEAIKKARRALEEERDRFFSEVKIKLDRDEKLKEWVKGELDENGRGECWKYIS